MRDSFTQYYPAVVSYLLRMGFSRDEARDLAQETFYRVYQGMASYRGEALWPYLRTTAHRVALNEIRKWETEMRQADEVPLTELLYLPEALARDAWTGVPPPSPEDELNEREIRQRLHAAITGLPEGLRCCLLLWLEDRKYPEIAALMQITIETVRSRLHRARELLRAALGEEPEGLDWPQERSGGRA